MLVTNPKPLMKTLGMSQGRGARPIVTAVTTRSISGVDRDPQGRVLWILAARSGLRGAIDRGRRHHNIDIGKGERDVLGDDGLLLADADRPLEGCQRHL